MPRKNLSSESEAEERRQQAARRQRRYRHRKRGDVMRITIDVAPAARAVLTEARWIGEWDEDDQLAVADALQRLVDGLKVDRADEA